VAFVAVLGTLEAFDLAARNQVAALRPLGILAAIGVPALGFLTLTDPVTDAFVARWWPFLAALWLLVLLVGVLLRRRPDQRPLAAAAVTLFAPLYAGALPAFLVVIRHARHGPASWAGTMLVFFPLVVTWVCDTAAMFGGRAIGGPKLAPTVSPGKTRSGAAAGVVAALLVVPIWLPLVFTPLGITVTPWHALVIAALIGVVGQVGDLAESLFKREAGVKDSSRLIPGHGGVLDRFDSLYVVLPLTALLYRAFGIL